MPLLFIAVLTWLFLCLPGGAAALEIQFAGDVDGVIDPDTVLDGSVALGTRVTGRYIVDPTPSGGGSGEVGSARLLFDVGSYRFDENETPHVITLINDRVVGPTTVDIWQTRELVAAQLTPPIALEPGGLGYAAGLQLFDFTAAQISGAELSPFIVDDLADWSSGRLTLNAIVDDLVGGVAIGRMQISVALDSWTVVPEPASAALLAAGLVGLALRRARR